MTSSNRLWILVTVVLGIAILALGWFLGVSPKLDQASATDESRTTVDALNQQKTIELVQLQKDSTNLPAIRTELTELLKQLPPNSDYPAFLTELNQIAGSSNISVTNVAFQPPTVLAPVAPTTGPSPAPSGTAAPPAVVTNAVPAGTTVAIPTTLTMTGSFDALQSATGDLQTGERLFLVSGLAFAKVDSGSGSGSSSASPSDAYKVDVTGTIFVLTDGSTLISSTATPAPTPTVSPTTAP